MGSPSKPSYHLKQPLFFCHATLSVTICCACVRFSFSDLAAPRSTTIWTALAKTITGIEPSIISASESSVAAFQRNSKDAEKNWRNFGQSGSTVRSVFWGLNHQFEDVLRILRILAPKSGCASPRGHLPAVYKGQDQANDQRTSRQWGFRTTYFYESVSMWGLCQKAGNAKSYDKKNQTNKSFAWTHC